MSQEEIEERMHLVRVSQERGRQTCNVGVHQGVRQMNPHPRVKRVERNELVSEARIKQTEGGEFTPQARMKWIGEKELA